jgi:predicted Zn-dependent protease
MATDIVRAREALEAGRKDEALVLLWNAVEPARLAGDEDALHEIAELARSVPGREGESLVAATGIEASASAPGSGASPPAEPRSGRAPIRRVLRVLLPLLVILLWLLVNVAGERSTPDEGGESEEVPAKATVGKDVFLVPLGGTPQLELEELVPDIHDRLGAQANVLPAVELRPQVLDAARGQLVGEELLLRLADTYGIVDDRAVIIGVVDGDMYARARPEQEFAVVVRSDDERYAVVSTARVARGPEATRSERIWNVIAREVRALYLHEAVETDPTRVG